MFQILLLILVLFSAPSWAKPLEAVGELTITSPQAFIYEDKTYRFEFVPTKNDPNLAYVLVEKNLKTQSVKFAWWMNDEGQRGDEKAGDNKFGLVMSYKEKQPKNLVFAVYAEEKNETNTAKAATKSSRTPPTLTTGTPLSEFPAHQEKTIQIVARPTMIDILETVVSRVFK